MPFEQVDAARAVEGPHKPALFGDGGGIQVQVQERPFLCVVHQEGGVTRSTVCLVLGCIHADPAHSVDANEQLRRKGRHFRGRGGGQSPWREGRRVIDELLVFRSDRARSVDQEVRVELLLGLRTRRWRLAAAGVVSLRHVHAPIEQKHPTTTTTVTRVAVVLLVVLARSGAGWLVSHADADGYASFLGRRSGCLRCRGCCCRSGLRSVCSMSLLSTECNEGVYCRSSQTWADSRRRSRVVGTRTPPPGERSVPLAGGLGATVAPVVHCIGSVPSDSVGGEQ